MRERRQATDDTLLFVQIFFKHLFIFFQVTEPLIFNIELEITTKPNLFTFIDKK